MTAETTEPHRRHAAPVVIGVLGGIASGKSHVAEGLAGPHGAVIEADAIAHEILSSEEGAAFVAERFGARHPEVLDGDGRPSRRALAALCFDPGEGNLVREALEDWIHPRVRARIRELLNDARAAGLTVLTLDIPLLLENNAQHGLADACDWIVFVEAEPATRDARARSTRAWNPGEVARREAAQLPLSEKRSRADHILPNNGTLEDLDRSIADLRRTLGLG